VEYALRFRSRFDASHIAEGVAGHERQHGHTFDVEVSVSGALELQPGGARRAVDADVIQATLDAICRELDLRHLNDMMVGSDPVPEVIAGWFLERIPMAEWVTVKMGWRGETGWAKRTRR
jgi:6-pyruvoyl-tetrahydropterin synthase